MKAIFYRTRYALRYDSIKFVDASDIGYIRQRETAKKLMSMIPVDAEMENIFIYPKEV